MKKVIWVDPSGSWKGDMHRMFWKEFWLTSTNTYKRYIIDGHNA